MKRWQTLAGVLPLALAVTACGSTADTAATTDTATTTETTTADTADTTATTEATTAATGTTEEAGDMHGGSDMGGGGNMNGGTLDKSWDTELADMLAEVEDLYTLDTYTDEESGLSVPYNIFVPDGYAQDGTAPILFFIGDATTVGDDTAYSLEQGWGGIVWATDAVQSVEQCIVVTLCFPESATGMNEDGTYSLTEYGELVPDMVTSIAEKYGADTSRIYGTGQSMGAMTTLAVASANPDLYAAVLIVDGQWNVDELTGLEDVDFIYVTAGGDERATTGQTEVKEMFDEDGISYAEISDLDANLMDDSSTKSEIEDAVQGMLDEGSDHNFITWTAGSVLTSYGGSGSEHMASFDYGYKLESVRDWILSH